VEFLIMALSDSDWNIRHKAAHALGEIGDSRAISALTKALQDAHAEVRKAAARSLGEMNWRD